MGGRLAILMCLLFAGYNEVEGNMKLSKEDDLELENQLKLRNKPSEKIIQTNYGDIYDCVDFFKQPAFEHPLLKNHNYHYKMKPQFLKKKRRVPPGRDDDGSIKIGLNESCPIGTVPIKRTTKEDLTGEKLLAQRLDSNGLVRYAIAKSKLNNPINFTGAEGVASTYNPKVSEGQYSTSRIHLENDEEYIQFGWRVDETTYRDFRTHQFISANSRAGLCFDLRCPFVVVSRNITPGLAYTDDQITKPGGQILSIKQSAKKDKDGNWWLGLGYNNDQVGFWPARLFTKLSQYATDVDFGGTVYSPKGNPSPQMGTGSTVTGDPKVDEYIGRLRVIDTNGNESDPETEGFADDPSEYNVTDTVLIGRIDRRYAHIVYFGVTVSTKNELPSILKKFEKY